MRTNVEVLRDHLKKYGLEVDRIGDKDVIEIADIIVNLEDELGYSLIWPYNNIRLIE